MGVARLDEQLVVGDLRITGKVVEAQDRRGRHVVLDGSSQEVRDRRAGGDLDHGGREIGEVRHPQGERGKPRVVGDLGTAERRAQTPKL